MGTVDDFIAEFECDISEVSEFENRRFIAERTLKIAIAGVVLAGIYFFFYDRIQEIIALGFWVYGVLGIWFFIFWFVGFYSDEVNKKRRELTEDKVMYHYLASAMNHFKNGQYSDTVESLNQFNHFQGNLSRRGRLDYLSRKRKNELLSYVDHLLSSTDPEDLVEKTFGEISSIIAEEIKLSKERDLDGYRNEEVRTSGASSIVKGDMALVVVYLITGYSGVILLSAVVGTIAYVYGDVLTGMTAIVVILTAYGAYATAKR